MEIFRLAVVFVAAIIAGAVNSVAGGGTVFNFTGLVWYGLPTVNANATNATSLIPGSLGGAVAMRQDLKTQQRDLIILLIPTVLASLLGALVVANTSESIFRRVVPFLILFATLIFASRNVITRWVQSRAASAKTSEQITPLGYALGLALQFLIAFYGGYFGAGIGILMLTSLSIMGMQNIHKMNALKNMLAVGINGTAAIFFVLSGRVVWPMALLAAVGSTIGGYGLGSYAKRIDQDTLRWGVVAAGLVVSAYMFGRLYLG
jgi:uncharacterized membrane protein YfcA